jgi:hypothetical protein
MPEGGSGQRDGNRDGNQDDQDEPQQGKTSAAPSATICLQSVGEKTHVLEAALDAQGTGPQGSKLIVGAAHTKSLAGGR